MVYVNVIGDHDITCIYGLGKGNMHTINPTFMENTVMKFFENTIPVCLNSHLNSSMVWKFELEGWGYQIKRILGVCNRAHCFRNRKYQQTRFVDKQKGYI